MFDFIEIMRDALPEAIGGLVVAAIVAIITVVRRARHSGRKKSSHKNKRPNYDRAVYQNEQEPLTFAELCLKIRPFLDENRRVRKSLGPNSGSNSPDPVRWDLTLWEKAKREINVPNNQKIAQYIKNHRDLIPPEYITTFEKMLTHIFAFEKHCETSNFEYSEHQFPDAFEDIINKICFETTLNDPILLAIEAWLIEKLEECTETIEGYLIGSILRGAINSANIDADVDIIIFYSARTYNEIKEYATKIGKVKNRFRIEFNRYLHVTAFSKLEQDTYYIFLSNINSKRRLPIRQG